MNPKKKSRIGVGFVTGRRNFKNVARIYLESTDSYPKLMQKNALHLFVAYDLKYKTTKFSDYKIMDDDLLGLVDTINYLGVQAIEHEAQLLVAKEIITLREASLLFEAGYAGKRNAILYLAIKNRMDALIFLDDDEYPLICIDVAQTLFWRGQSVIQSHIGHIGQCDITNGHHCGYISPIPSISFNEVLPESTFQRFIQSISNDIITWKSIRKKMDQHGVTYAGDEDSDELHEVFAENGMKFISGSNLGINLSNCEQVFPFYNPPNARGEDTFLSTCLAEHKVHRIPTFTFHDGFSSCQSILYGALPEKFNPIAPTSASVTKRFLKACIGWIRYKPLLLYTIQRQTYHQDIAKIRADLTAVIPSLCQYFKNDGFLSLLAELDKYDQLVTTHYQDFEDTKTAWKKVMLFLKQIA